MSSRNAAEIPDKVPGPATATRAWSLATRLTLWYAISAFCLVLAATGYLYWASVSNLDREDDQLLGDRVRVLRAVLLNRPGDMDALRREVNEEWEARQRSQVHMRIVDGSGRILVETPEMSRQLPHSSFPEPSSEPEHGADIDAAGGGVYRVLAVSVPASGPKQLPYVIQVAMDRSLETELRAAYRRNLFFVIVAALAVCAAIGYRIARAGIRPICQITETADRVRSSNLSERVNPDGLPRELLELAGTFNQMLDRLEQSFARVSQFSADIAHELRTPVYNLRGEAEVALSKPRSAEEYREVLASGLEECARLAHLIDRLLFLARADKPETQVNRERCDLIALLTKVSDFYSLPAAEKDVRLVVVGEKPVEADLDRPLVQRAVSNLVANALAHTPARGSVTMLATGDNGSARIEVVDTGCGIAPSHLPHVFERLYRVDNSRTSANGSVGLGLAIVQRIVQLHGGTIEIDSAVGRGTKVTLIFPEHRG